MALLDTAITEGTLTNAWCRVQESVFELWTTKQDRLKLRKQIQKCLDFEHDLLAMYVLPPLDCKDIKVIGTGSTAPDDRNWIV